MPFEWDEPIPQPPPPINRVKLVVQTLNWSPDTDPLGAFREATQDDIAKALGVTAQQLRTFLGNPHGHSGLWTQLNVAGQEQTHGLRWCSSCKGSGVEGNKWCSSCKGSGVEGNK